MLEARTILGAVRGWHVAAFVVGAVAVTTTVAVEVERRRANVREIRWLRARLADKAEVIVRQRRELAQVAAAIDHAVQAAAPVRERNEGVRRLAEMEQSREPEVLPLEVLATLDGAPAQTSEATVRSLESLAWLRAQLASMDDSVALLTALLTDRPRRRSGAPIEWPIDGTITSPFGPRRSPWGEGRQVHTGIDIKAPYGTPVVAAGAGEILFAGRDGGYGSLVVVDHGGDVQTFYGHLAAIYVREGQKVRAGDVVGAVGASGRATGIHLHYEVRVQDRPVDPIGYLAKHGVRKAAHRAGALTSIRPAAIDVSRRADLVGP
jgi:murein DD-endopeptidase MepM/ murein hydrolase activator NlpD